MRLPDFVGIGAMRSGSTTLWHLLNQHEKVFLPELKELHFFDNREGNWERGVEHYARHFETAPPGAVCGEFTPSYMYIEEARDRIKQVVPQARFLAVLRNPVERAWSHYWYMVTGFDEPLSFEDAVEAERDRTANEDLNVRFKYSYVARGRYYDQLVRFEQCFSREQLCVILLDDLKTRPLEVMNQVYEHLRLDPPQRPLSTLAPRENSSRYPPRRGLHRAGKRLLVWGEGGGSLLHGIARRTGRTVSNRVLVPGTPEMNPETRCRLAAEFAEGNRQLAEWLGRPLPW